MELQGTIKKISETQTFASGFQKKEMVILTQEQYPQPINIEFLQDKINLPKPLIEKMIRGFSYSYKLLRQAKAISIIAVNAVSLS